MNSFLLCEKEEAKVKLKKNGGCAAFRTLEVSSYDASYPLLSFKDAQILLSGKGRESQLASFPPRSIDERVAAHWKIETLLNEIRWKWNSIFGVLI